MKQKRLDTIILEEAIRAKLTEQTFNAKAVAKKIYDAKGFVWDNEYDAVKAILSIKDASQYNQVQTELQKLTGGKGIAQYVSSFIAVRDSVNSKYGPIGIRYVKSIMDHLTKIKANPKSIDIFKKELTRLITWYQASMAAAEKGAGQTQFAWETWTQRALKDPEFKHAYLTSLSIVAALIPGGAALSTMIGLGDSYVYYQEGDKYTAGLVALLSLIPGGSAATKALTKKLIARSGALTAAETAIIKKAAASKSLINAQIGKLLQKGVESGKITDAMLRSIPKIVKPVGKGVYNVVGTGIRIVTPMLAYDAAWAAANPNVTEAEMLTISKQEQQLLSKNIDAMFNAALTENLQLEAMPTPDELDPETSTNDSSYTNDVIFWGSIIITGLTAKWGLSRFFNKLSGRSRAKYTIREKWQMLVDRRRINKILRSNNVRGLTKKKYRSLLRTISTESEDNIKKLITDVQNGVYTPEQAVREFRNVYPGEVTDKYMELIRRKFSNVAEKTAEKTSTTIQQQPYTGTKMGFQQGKTVPRNWKYPNVTPTEFDELSYHERVILQQNPDLSLKDLRKRY